MSDQQREPQTAFARPLFTSSLALDRFFFVLIPIYQQYNFCFRLLFLFFFLSNLFSHAFSYDKYLSFFSRRVGSDIVPIPPVVRDRFFLFFSLHTRLPMSSIRSVIAVCRLTLFWRPPQFCFVASLFFFLQKRCSYIL